MDQERARLLSERQQAVKRLAKAAEHEERWDDAAHWWGRAVAADPYNSRVVVRRMWALVRGGDRANAVKDAEAHCRLLKSELDLDPDPAFLEELESIRGGDPGVAQYFTPGPGFPVVKSPGS
jgi:DNA-binding SARP family transcriptional activator